EELDFRKQAGFSPDGRNLLFYEENAANEYTLRMMPVDSAESQVYTLLTGVASPFPVAWSPDSAELAVGSDGRLQSFSTGTGNVARAWDTGRWRVMPVAWSPDGRYLTLQGVNLSEQEEALFVVDTLQ
ncbi:WD40 repeat domain-containing protein, partial [Promineifilum sp.]|uniref:WD40 repeat domain-containing protein n=1 Tax=Promineifilum sp. TaxID=2664178 RepID=UPI0035B24A6D